MQSAGWFSCASSSRAIHGDPVREHRTVVTVAAVQKIGLAQLLGSSGSVVWPPDRRGTRRGRADEPERILLLQREVHEIARVEYFHDKLPGLDRRLEREREVQHQG